MATRPEMEVLSALMRTKKCAHLRSSAFMCGSVSASGSRRRVVLALQVLLDDVVR
jgi:hypothetical protein